MSDETKDKHTPGPWSCKAIHNGETAILDPDRKRVVVVMDWKEMEANAKLIAAAPELLAALVLCVQDYEDDLQKTDAWQKMHLGYVDRESTPSHIMAAQAAIDKARNGA
jgi:hypothetical protein